MAKWVTRREFDGSWAVLVEGKENCYIAKSMSQEHAEELVYRNTSKNDIVEASIRLLRSEGYAVVEITHDMEERMNKCANGIDEECMGCCVSVCLLQEV